jgi:ligand-binding sensor domain-containing protein
MRQIFIIILFFSYTFASSQTHDYIFHHIDQSNGLLHNNVLSITQGNDGFIWIGTNNGLQRYDGLRFVNYQDELSNWKNKSIAVNNVYVDSNSRVWVLSEYQVGKLETLNDKFTGYNADQMLKDPIFKYETYTDSQNTRWLLGDFGIYKYDSVTKKMELYLLNLPNGIINSGSSIIRDNEHNITWVASWHGLLLFDAKTKKVYSSKYNPLQHPLLKMQVHLGYSKIMMDSHKNIWLCSWDHLLYKYDPVTQKITTYSLSDIKKSQGDKKKSSGTSVVYCIYEDNRSNIWVGTENAGLLKYNVKEDKFDYIIKHDGNEQGIQYNYNIFCIFQDKEENIWIGTDKGISIFNPYHQYFQSIHHQENNSQSLPKNEITAFIETHTGDILAGTWGGGITVYNNNLNFKKNIFLKGAYENNLVWSLLQNDNGKIWIGCQHGYLNFYDPVNETIQTNHPPELHKSTIRCMQKDPEGNIWLGLQNGKIVEWNKSLNRFFSYNEKLSGISQKFSPVLNIFIDHNTNFWISTDEGLKQFDPLKRIYTAVYLPDNNNPSSISAKSIRGIEQYDDSTLVIGTINGGLNFFNTLTKKFSHYTKNDGLPSDFIYAIKKDAENNMWITTDYGMYQFRMKEKKSITYNIESGMINSSFVSDNFYPLHDGRWLTATSTEIISFHPDSLRHLNDYGAKVAITGLKVFDKPVFIDSLMAKNKPVVLNYQQNFLTIEFAALVFSGIQQTKYYYRLTEVDKDWVDADTRGYANYTNLAAGDYTFSVKAAQVDSAAKISSFKIIIEPPVWNTWWFKTLIILVIGLSAYILIKRRIKTIRNEAELKHKIAETEMMALRSQMNPHFIFNCLNAIDNLIQTNQKDKATTYLARFAKLIRVVLDSSKNNVVPFHKEYEALNLFLQLEQFRCNNKFQYELKADDEILQGDYKVPPLLIQPFIENAIHHGLMNKPGIDKKLSVQIGVENEKIKYTIEDNGVGRQKALQIKNLNKPEHISYGIQISTERIHLYNKNGDEKDIVITDLYKKDKPDGTKIEVLVKIYNN